MTDHAAGAEFGPRRTQPELQALFLEVQALAIQLRKLLAAAHNADGLPPGGRSILEILLEHGPCTVPDIGRLRFTSRQNIQVEANQLKMQGLVEFLGNPDHKKSSLLRLTGRGRALVNAALDREERLLAGVVDAQQSADLADATVLLRGLRKALAGQQPRPVRRGQPPAPSRATARPAEIPAESRQDSTGPEELPVNLL